MRKTFRNNLRKYMKEKDVIAKELSYYTGIPYQTINNYILNTTPIVPNAFNAVKIARALGVTVEDLCREDE